MACEEEKYGLNLSTNIHFTQSDATLSDMIFIHCFVLGIALVSGMHI